MNTENKEFAEQRVQDGNILGNPQESGELIDGEEDGVIELTDVVEDSLGRDAGSEGDEGDIISLDAEALEEEEIIELVDAVEDDSEAEDDVLELTDVVEDDTFQPEAEPMDGSAAEEESDEGLVHEDLMDEDLSEDIGLGLEEEDADMPGAEPEGASSEPSIEMEDIAMAEDASEADETVEDVDLAPDTVPSFEAPVEPEGPDAEELIRERLSDEKIEAIITKVVKDTIEEKADRILLEVAEAAIAKEIEKIKKAL